MAKRITKLVKEIETTKNDIDRLKLELQKKEEILSLLLKEKDELDSIELLELIKSKMTLHEAKEFILSR